MKKETYIWIDDEGYIREWGNIPTSGHGAGGERISQKRAYQLLKITLMTWENPKVIK